MEPLITIPLKEWNALQDRIKRDEDELSEIYSTLKPLQPARNADEWGINLVNILVARLSELEKIVAAQHGVQPTADHASVSDSTETENVAGRGG